MCGTSLVDVISRHADKKPKAIPAASVSIKRRPLRPPIYKIERLYNYKNVNYNIFILDAHIYKL